MKARFFAASLATLACLFLSAMSYAAAQAPASKSSAAAWASEPPAGNPFENSKEITGIAFTGRHAQYVRADTWYPSWAANGNLYTPWTDGEVNGVHVSSGGKDPRTGYAIVHGDDPMRLEISDASTYPSAAAPYGGRYPSANLFYRGVWYYGTYCLYETPGKHLNWDVLGPFVGFRYSMDHGKTWHQTTTRRRIPSLRSPIILPAR